MTSTALQTLELSRDIPPHLPPHDAWKVDPDRLEKFYVPVDDRGFVKPKAAIESVLCLFDEGYEWPVDWSRDAPHILRPDDHHFHWIAARYNKKLYPGEYDLERYVKRYDEIYKSYTQTKYKALGLRALSVIGEKDVNIESYREVYERLGSCALLNTPNYTRQYFSRSSQ